MINNKRKDNILWRFILHKKMILNVLIGIILAQELSTDGSKSSSVIISIYVFILKVHLRIMELFAREICKFLKK